MSANTIRKKLDFFTKKMRIKIVAKLTGRLISASYFLWRLEIKQHHLALKKRCEHLCIILLVIMYVQDLNSWSSDCASDESFNPDLDSGTDDYLVQQPFNQNFMFFTPIYNQNTEI